MKWLELAKTILTLLPIILQAIAAVEQQIGAGNGPAKKELIMGAIGAAGAPEADGVADAISKTVDMSVGVLNKVGVFK